ncbi:hypothetical protein MKW98_020958, partial [Papaver atlanticum]
MHDHVSWAAIPPPAKARIEASDFHPKGSSLKGYDSILDEISDPKAKEPDRDGNEDCIPNPSSKDHGSV